MRANRIGSMRWFIGRLPRICGHAGRAASVGFMASRPPSSDDQLAASPDEPRAPSERDDGLAAAAPDQDDEADDELDQEVDEDEEDLVVFTAKEAAGALATI